MKLLLADGTDWRETIYPDGESINICGEMSGEY